MRRMKRTYGVAILVGLAAVALTTSQAHARHYMMAAGANVYPAVAAPIPPRPAMPGIPTAAPPLAAAPRPHVGVNIYPGVATPRRTPTPRANTFSRPHVGVNVYPSVPTPGIHPDGPNLYQYVRSNPVKYTDSTGMAVDPGRDCGLISRADWGNWIGPIKKPSHFWINGRGNELWDFGPDQARNRAIYGNDYNFHDCSLFMPCHGEANWGNNAYANRAGTINNPLKLQLMGWLWAGPSGVKGKECHCVTCDDIKKCLSAVRRQWDDTRYDHLGRHCGNFVMDALAKCCMWGM